MSLNPLIFFFFFFSVYALFNRSFFSLGRPHGLLMHINVTVIFVMARNYNSVLDILCHGSVLLFLRFLATGGSFRQIRSLAKNLKLMYFFNPSELKMWLPFCSAELWLSEQKCHRVKRLRIKTASETSGHIVNELSHIRKDFVYVHGHQKTRFPVSCFVNLVKLCIPWPW